MEVKLTGGLDVIFKCPSSVMLESMVTDENHGIRKWFTAIRKCENTRLCWINIDLMVGSSQTAKR